MDIRRVFWGADLFILVCDLTDAPAGAYYTSIVGTDYDWKHKTVPQPKLNNRVIDWPRGKVRISEPIHRTLVC